MIVQTPKTYQPVVKEKQIIDNKMVHENDKNWTENYSEEEKIHLLLFVDLLKKLNLRELGIDNETKEKFLKNLDNILGYEILKTSLKTRQYFWSTRSMDKKEQFYLKDLIRYLKDAISRLEKGRKDMLITNNQYPSKSIIPSVGKIVWGIFSFIRKIAGVITLDPSAIATSITVPLNVKNIIEGSVEIQELTKKQFDLDSQVVKDGIEYIKNNINAIEKCIYEAIDHNSGTLSDNNIQEKMLHEINRWIYEFNIIIKDITDIPLYETTLLDNYQTFIYEVILNQNSSCTGTCSAWIYNPIIGDYYDPY
ncbi:hypothetical protein ACNQ2T_00345 [Mycoplasma sp. Z407A]|uniref:hypothetical protein n=1 Tax=Mycoplasma sp. Z407A TaxID=3401678 RepID=UPI003AAF03D9